jgi:hypothetical protein
MKLGMNFMKLHTFSAWYFSFMLTMLIYLLAENVKYKEQCRNAQLTGKEIGLKVNIDKSKYQQQSHNIDLCYQGTYIYNLKMFQNLCV